MTELRSNIITESLRDKNRIEWVDRCKCIAIYLVVFGHFCLDNKYVYAFHMPLFFFLSGYVFNEKKYTSKKFLKSRINGILIPYFFFYLLTWMYWLVVERNFRSVDLEWWQPLLGLIYSSPQLNGYMGHNAVLWFLPCLFIVETIVFLILKHVPKISYQVFILTILTIIGFCSSRALPWCLNIALPCLQFFYIGKLLSKLNFDRFNSKLSPFIFFIIASAFLIGLNISGNEVNIVSSLYDSIPEFEIFAYLGIFGFVFLFQIKPTDKQMFKSCLSTKHGGVIEYVGKNTLIIFALHMPVLRIVKVVFEKFYQSINYDTDYVIDSLLSLIVIVILLPAIPLYNKIKPKLPRIR